MKIASGIDIVEIERIKKSVERVGSRFIETIYTEAEVKYCEQHGNNKYQHYAARFAAKEALYKALNTILCEDTLNWKSYEILNDEKGKPVVKIDNEKILSIDLSISHCKEYAVASVSVLYNE